MTPNRPQGAKSPAIRLFVQNRVQDNIRISNPHIASSWYPIDSPRKYASHAEIIPLLWRCQSRSLNLFSRNFFDIDCKPLFCFRLTLLRSSEARQMLDGLNTVYYTMVDYKEQPLYTNITIRVNIRYVKNYLAKIGFSIWETLVEEGRNTIWETPV